MTDEHRSIDPHIANLERDVAVIRSETAGITGAISEIRKITERNADQIDGLREQLANPALSATGRLLDERGVDNRARIARLESRIDEPRSGYAARIDDLERSRDEWRGALVLVRAAVGTSIIGTAVAVIALILAVAPHVTPK